ncbi:MAG: preprotein translocase subunit YajC, partial [Flavobacteriales bacterium]
GGGYGSLIFMGGFFLIFYFFMIRPQMRKAKEQKKFQQALAIGDRVTTLGGVFGEVIEMDETSVVLKLDQGRMRVLRQAISSERSVAETLEKK